MPLSKEAVYNDLNGQEAREILSQRFEQRLNEIPWLQRHLTLPRVRMKLSVVFELYADQPTPESHAISDDFTIRIDSSDAADTTSLHSLEPHLFETEDLIDASPETGEPPEKLREDHHLPTTTPKKNPVTKQTEDVPDDVQLIPGVSIHRCRSGQANPSTGATIITQDFGNRFNRRDQEQAPSPFRNKDNRSGEVAPPQADFRNTRR